MPLDLEGTSLAQILVRSWTSTPGLAATFDGQNIDGGSTSEGSLLSTQIANPGDGTLHIANPGAADATVTVGVSIVTAKLLNLALSTDAVPVNGSAQIDLTLSQATGSEVASAYLKDAAGSRSDITLTQVGTGHWTGTVTPTTAGPLTVYVQTTGSQPRFTAKNLDAFSTDITVAPGFTEKLIDKDHDGLADTLQIGLQVTATKAGKFDLVAHLADSTGKEIEPTTGLVQLVVGTQPVLLDFNGAGIYQSGQSGPYRILGFVLGDPSNQDVTVAKIDDLGSTSAYDYHQFEH